MTTFRRAILEIQNQVMQEALDRLGSVTLAAEELKIGRSTIYRKIWDGSVTPPPKPRTRKPCPRKWDWEKARSLDLRQVQICERFGVSRETVRVAFKKLGERT